MSEIDLFAVQARAAAETYRSTGAFRGTALRPGRPCAARREGADPPALTVSPEAFLALARLGSPHDGRRPPGGAPDRARAPCLGAVAGERGDRARAGAGRTRGLPALLLALVAACGGGPDPCATSAACPEGTVCQPSGECTALATRGPPAPTRWLAARDWAVTLEADPRERVDRTDVLRLGGDAGATAWLSFGPLPRDREVTRALLALHPHESWSGPGEPAQVRVYRTRAFDGAALTHRGAPPRLGGAVVDRPVLAGGPRPIVLDVTDAVRHAYRTGNSRLHLAVLLSGGGDLEWRLASPRAVDAGLRPRLELTLR